MAPEQKQLVKGSWARVLPIHETAAELFYTRLFERDLEVRPYFETGDMKAQGRKLMAMLNAAVNGLDDLESLTRPLRTSGKARSNHGVQAEDCVKVADALTWALGERLADDFTLDVKEAWVAAHSAVASVMIRGRPRTGEAAGRALTRWPQRGPGL